MHDLNPNLIAAFVFPDGSFLDASGVGHYKKAKEYVEANQSYEQRFKILSSKPKSQIHSEEDFLIQILGAVKLASYCVLGKKIYYNEKLANPEIVKYYVSLGFKDPFESLKPHILFNATSYNQTIIIKHVEGKETLVYNPMRIGD